MLRMQRHHFTPFDSVSYIWKTLKLPQEALNALDLIEDAECLPSSFKVGHLAQASIAVSALTASLLHSVKHQTPLRKVTVPMEHACVEFKSERLYTLNGKSAPSSWGTLGGLHKTVDGYVRMHDSFPNHRTKGLEILGLGSEASREDVETAMSKWKSVDLETEAFRVGAMIVALRSIEEWNQHPQALAVVDFPISVQMNAAAQPYIPRDLALYTNDKCLRGIRVVEMSRVIAAPVAGKTLAAHGADVIWITSPSLPDLPALDRDVSRGKRTVQLDIKQPHGKKTLLDLLRTADVFIQSYRPGSLAAQGLSMQDLTKANPNLIFASLSAYGTAGPWCRHRGFDSLVQTCSGINVADAKRHGTDEPVRVLPCQALDHGAGYLLATGIMAALYKRAKDGGSYDVHVSLAGVMRYMRSLGQYPGKSGFERKDFMSPDEVKKYLETRKSAFGELRSVKHSASVEGLGVGWEVMPKPLGSDEARWL